jgi:hypothetical protein
MVKTNPFPPLVSSDALSPGTNQLRNIKAPVSIPNPWLWTWVGLGLVLAGLLAWWLWRRSRRPLPPPPPEPILPAHEKARMNLKEALALLQEPRSFCILVSDTIRVYLEERFQLHAPERTTEEFLEVLQTSALLSYEQKQILGDFLVRCDLVKFARYEPGSAELQAIYDTAVRLVEETQPPLTLANQSAVAPGVTSTPEP